MSLLILIANYICNLRGEALITFFSRNPSMFQGREGLIIKMGFNAAGCGTTSHIYRYRYAGLGTRLGLFQGALTE